MPETNVLDQIEEPQEKGADHIQQKSQKSVVESARSVLKRFGAWLTEDDRKTAPEAPTVQQPASARDSLDANLASYAESPLHAMNPSRRSEKVAAARVAVLDYLANPTDAAEKNLREEVLTGDEYARLKRLIDAGITKADFDRVSKYTVEDFAEIPGHDPSHTPDIDPRGHLKTIAGGEDESNEAIYPHSIPYMESHEPHPTPQRQHRVHRPRHEAHTPNRNERHVAPVNHSPERSTHGPIGRRANSHGRHRANTVVRRGDYSGISRHEAPKVLA